MKRYRILLLAALLLPAYTGSLLAQETTWSGFRQHNAEMTKLQPPMISPLVAADPRLIQFARFSVARQRTAAGTETVNFFNGRGGGVIVARRFEFDVTPPPYVEHNSSAQDGFGDVTALAKVRVASGGSEHGNYAVAAMVAHSFATGSAKNGARTDVWCPTLAGGKTFGKRFDVITALGGTMPTGKIAAQGRSIAWNTTAQLHATHAVWLELEDNATFYFAGSRDRQMQNFVTPAVFYVVRPKRWEPSHSFLIVDAGMQIATSRAPSYNHNLISEVRILF
jgi:hypothetical protein